MYLKLSPRSLLPAHKETLGVSRVLGDDNLKRMPRVTVGVAR